MGTQTLTGSVTLIPNSYTGLTNMTINSGYSINNAYADSSSTNYARFDISTSSTGYIYFLFDTDDIPANATITSITGQFKAKVSNTTRVSNTVAQLYSGTTSKGSNVTFGSTTASVKSLSPGAASTWTRANLNDLRLRIGGTGSSSTSSKRIDFYGANITIGYSYTVTTYDVTINNSSSAIVTADNTTPVAGDTVKITSDTIANITVTDNNTDVTSQFVESHDATVISEPSNSTSSGFTVTNAANAYHGYDNTTYAQLQLSGGGSTGTFYLNFGNLNIPSGVTISSVTCQFTYEYNRNNSSSGYTASCQMYSGSTAKGSSSSLVSAGGTAVAKTTINLTTGSWTASDFSDTRIYITATNNASQTVRYLYVYGATVTVVYQMAGSVYIYTISNVQGNHTIVVTSSGSTDKILYKDSTGNWVQATKVYKKVNGSWVEQSDLTTVFDSNTNYVKG